MTRIIAVALTRDFLSNFDEEIELAANEEVWHALMFEPVEVIKAVLFLANRSTFQEVIQDQKERVFNLNKYRYD